MIQMSVDDPLFAQYGRYRPHGFMLNFMSQAQPQPPGTFSKLDQLFSTDEYGNCTLTPVGAWIHMNAKQRWMHSKLLQTVEQKRAEVANSPETRMVVSSVSYLYSNRHTMAMAYTTAQVLGMSVGLVLPPLNPQYLIAGESSLAVMRQVIDQAQSQNGVQSILDRSAQAPGASNAVIPRVEWSPGNFARRNLVDGDPREGTDPIAELQAAAYEYLVEYVKQAPGVFNPLIHIAEAYDSYLFAPTSANEPPHTAAVPLVERVLEAMDNVDPWWRHEMSTNYFLPMMMRTDYAILSAWDSASATSDIPNQGNGVPRQLWANPYVYEDRDQTVSSLTTPDQRYRFHIDARPDDQKYLGCPYDPPSGPYGFFTGALEVAPYTSIIPIVRPGIDDPQGGTALSLGDLASMNGAGPVYADEDRFRNVPGRQLRVFSYPVPDNPVATMFSRTDGSLDLTGDGIVDREPEMSSWAIIWTQNRIVPLQGPFPRVTWDMFFPFRVTASPPGFDPNADAGSRQYYNSVVYYYDAFNTESWNENVQREDFDQPRRKFVMLDSGVHTSLADLSIAIDEKIYERTRSQLLNDLWTPPGGTIPPQNRFTEAEVDLIVGTSRRNRYIPSTDPNYQWQQIGRDFFYLQLEMGPAGSDPAQMWCVCDHTNLEGTSLMTPDFHVPGNAPHNGGWNNPLFGPGDEWTDAGMHIHYVSGPGPQSHGYTLKAEDGGGSK